MLLINGKQEHCIPITDRGFQYGDGLFETIEIYQGHAFFLRQHLQRLEKGCLRLNIPFPGSRLLKQEIKQLLDISKDCRAVLKLIITRGSGGRGFRPPETIQATRVVSLHVFPDYPGKLKEAGIKARFCHFRLGHNPQLAGVKHLNRLEQVLARAEWKQDDIQEGLLLDINDNVIEGTMSNVFCIKDKKLLTPKLDLNGIEGIIRRIILENAEAVKTVRLNKQDIIAADELFVTNSIIGLWPIKQIEQHRYALGPITQKVVALLTACRQRDLQHVL